MIEPDEDECWDERSNRNTGKGRVGSSALVRRMPSDATDVAHSGNPTLAIRSA